jgi:glycosyltransferase involved in cell wall biosynthesis
MTPGVSIVICCYNSAQRLPRTLAHLAVQQVRKTLKWEVIIVDNASLDNTGEIAVKTWNTIPAAPLRVVPEPRSGLVFARNRGLVEAKYDIVSFVDDDNWVCPEWVQLAYEVMNEAPDLGACGGLSEAVCEVKPPIWFEDNRSSYAIGPHGLMPGDITNTRGWLWGAGLSVRKPAWQQLVSNGFSPLLIDRQGKKLGAGADSELCLALRLAGWRLWYDPRLRFQHFLPAQRLKWTYLRKLHRGFGASTVGHDPYLRALGEMQSDSATGSLWCREAILAMKRIYWSKRSLLPVARYSSQGNAEVLYIERQIGRLSELFRKRARYDLTVRNVHRAAWRLNRVNFVQNACDHIPAGELDQSF